MPQVQVIQRQEDPTVKLLSDAGDSIADSIYKAQANRLAGEHYKNEAKQAQNEVDKFHADLKFKANELYGKALEASQKGDKYGAEVWFRRMLDLSGSDHNHAFNTAADVGDMNNKFYKENPAVQARQQDANAMQFSSDNGDRYSNTSGQIQTPQFGSDARVGAIQGQPTSPLSMPSQQDQSQDPSQMSEHDLIMNAQLPPGAATPEMVAGAQVRNIGAEAANQGLQGASAALTALGNQRTPWGKLTGYKTPAMLELENRLASQGGQGVLPGSNTQQPPQYDPKTQKLQRNKTTGEFRVVPL